MFENILTKETTAVKAKTGLVEYTKSKYISEIVEKSKNKENIYIQTR